MYTSKVIVSISFSGGVKEGAKRREQQHFDGGPALMVAGCECWCMMLHVAGKHHVQHLTTVLRVVVSNRVY